MKKILTSIALCAFVSCSAAPIPSTSGLASVVIPQTSVKDQGSIGFCWAYTTAAFIEAETLRRTGRTIDVSEEFIGLYRIAAELASDLRSGMDTQEIQSKIQDGSYEGWFVRLPAKWDAEATDAMELVDAFGILEEREFSVKFQSPAAAFPFEPTPLMANGGYKPVLSRLVAQLDAKTPDSEIVAAVAESFGKDAPPAGHKSAIKAKDYEAFWAEKAADVPEIVTKLRTTLARGIAVPFGYGVTFNKLSRANGYKWEGGEGTDLSTYERMSVGEARRGYARDGGHAVLVTDFVNVGGREGYIGAGSLEDAVLAPWNQLDYLVFKNSWGTDTGLPPGYYRVDLPYMLGAGQAGVLDIVVPRN